jgi:hypothetical protein
MCLNDTHGLAAGSSCSGYWHVHVWCLLSVICTAPVAWYRYSPILMSSAKQLAPGSQCWAHISGAAQCISVVIDNEFFYAVILDDLR